MFRLYIQKLAIFYSLSLFCIFASSPLWANDILTRRIEDDSALRRALYSTWFNEAPARVLQKPPELHTLRGGSRIQVRVETSSQNREEFAIVLARAHGGAFSGWGQGSWILTRRIDGNAHGSRIRIFLRSDFNTYVQFRPLSETQSLMDVVLYDAYIVRSAPVPLPFERLMVLPIEDALSAAGASFPRRYFEPAAFSYADSINFVANVRQRLPELSWMDDGALNERGEFVFINTLARQNNEPTLGGVNCSGTVKWIVDGILRPLTGERLEIAPLKAPFISRAGSSIEHWEELRDPYFGLDWNRNLASRAGAVLRSPSFSALEEIEVRHSPFSLIIQRQNGRRTVEQYHGFIENAGFPTEGLLPLLYTLAIDVPGRIYLAAVNDEHGARVTPANPRGLPRLRQYYHVAALVPYFNEAGAFHVAVFESAAETSINRFRNRYPGQFVNLVRIPIEGSFSP
jgi:hypothetical protein